MKNGVSYIDRLVEKGLIKKPMGSGQKWIFDIQDFPQSTHDKLR